MTFEKIDFFTNNSENEIFLLKQENLKIARYAKVLNSFFEGMNEIGDFSCVNRSSFGVGTHVSVSSYVSDTKLGRYCMIGSRVSLGGFEHPTSWLSVAAFQWGQSINHYNLEEETKTTLGSRPKPGIKNTLIGNDVWVGNNAVIKAGVTIADGAIIGAGSVVTKDVGPYQIFVGNPAKFLRMRFSEETVSELLALKWWFYDLSELANLNFSNVLECIKFLKLKNKKVK